MAPRSTSFALALVLFLPVAAGVFAQSGSAAQTTPRTPMDQMNAQLATPTLNPAATVTVDLTATSLRDIIAAIASAGGITVRYHSGVTNLDVSAAVKLSNATVQDALQMAMTVSKALAFKVTGAKSVFIYPDTPENRQKYTETRRTFSIVNAGTAALTQILNQALTDTFGPDDLRPVIVSDNESRTIIVRATADTMTKVAKIIADSDKK